MTYSYPPRQYGMNYSRIHGKYKNTQYFPIMTTYLFYEQLEADFLGLDLDLVTLNLRTLLKPNITKLVHFSPLHYRGITV